VPHRIGAAALVLAYLLPTLLPGAGPLAHDAYHAVVAHAHVEEDEGHIQADEDEGHVHAEGGERHLHAPLVDMLLAVSSQEDEVGPGPVTGPVVTASSHLAARRPSPDIAPTRESRPLRDKPEVRPSFPSDPEIPPPRM